MSTSLFRHGVVHMKERPDRHQEVAGVPGVTGVPLVPGWGGSWTGAMWRCPAWDRDDVTSRRAGTTRIMAVVLQLRLR